METTKAGTELLVTISKHQLREMLIALERADAPGEDAAVEIAWKALGGK